MRLDYYQNTYSILFVVQLHECSHHLANTEWARSFPKPLSKGVIYLRIKEFDIPVTTAKAEPYLSRVKNNALFSNTGEPQEAKERFNPDDVKACGRAMAGYFDAGHHPMVRKAVKGSMKAAIRLKCLDCCADNKAEIKNCNVTTCPLWLYRPFQG